MKVCFIYAEKDGDEEGRELILAKAFLAGLDCEGDVATKSESLRNPPDAPIVCMVGVKSLKLFRQMQRLGKRVIYFDKGYLRHRGPHRTWEYWRVAVDDHHPTGYVTDASHTPRRWNAIAKRRAIEVAPWRDMNTGGPGVVVYAGSSEKYHAFAGLPEPTEYASGIIKKIKEITGRIVIYRPKPTWYDAVPVKGAQYSPRTASIEDALNQAWCLVTNGSNASYDAIIKGIPCIVLGNAIAKPISSHSLEYIEKPYLASQEEKMQWFSNLAWCQFTEAEMRAGLAWKAIKPQLDGGYLDDSELDDVAIGGIRPTKALLKKAGVWGKAKNKPFRTKTEQRQRKPFKKGRKDAGLSE